MTEQRVPSNGRLRAARIVGMTDGAMPRIEGGVARSTTTHRVLPHDSSAKRVARRPEAMVAVAAPVTILGVKARWRWP
jgi:hypothetical protein